jgi:hypothetical protein
VPSLITRVFQRGVDVIPERVGHARNGADDPAEPSHRGDRQQDISNLVFRGARCQSPGGAPLKADRRRSDRRQRSYPDQRRGLELQAPGPGKPFMRSARFNIAVPHLLIMPAGVP